MISGRTQTQAPADVLRVACCIVTILAAVSADAFDLADLAALRAGVAEAHAQFHEVRHVRALQAPLERSGTLVFRRPDFLEMKVDPPRAEDLVIQGRSLHIVSATGERTIALDTEPALLGWTESIRATLAGDTAALARYFDVRLGGDASAWVLTLEPRDAALRSAVQSIAIAGAGAAVRRVTVREVGGDDAVTDIVPTPP
jgi:hypothetical protein